MNKIQSIDSEMEVKPDMKQLRYWLRNAARFAGEPSDVDFLSSIESLTWWLSRQSLQPIAEAIGMAAMAMAGMLQRFGKNRSRSCTDFILSESVVSSATVYLCIYIYIDVYQVFKQGLTKSSPPS